MKHFLRIYKQDPHLGTEGDLYTERQAQARRRPYEEVKALLLFTEMGAKYLP